MNRKPQLGSLLLGALISLAATAQTTAQTNEATTQPSSRADNAYYLDSVSANLPDESSYTYCSEQRVPVENTFFNTESITELRDVTCTGLHVIFDPSDPRQPLNRYDQGGNIRSLVIEAERVTIAAPLHLPGTDVEIRAHTLVFQDTDPATPAVIDTTPLPWSLPESAPGKDGAAGQRAGNLTLLGEQIEADGGHVRFRLNGGNGQDPGAGRDGQNGKALTSLLNCITPYFGHLCYPFYFSQVQKNPALRGKNAIYRDIYTCVHQTCRPLTNRVAQQGVISWDKAWTFFGRLSPALNINEHPGHHRLEPDHHVIIYVHYSYEGQTREFAPHQKDIIANNGTDAVAGGKAGDGGSGGRLLSNLAAAADLSEHVGGEPGAPTRIYKGGKRGTPVHWRMVKEDENRHDSWIKTIKRGTTTNGKDAPARPGQKGAAGQFVLVNESLRPDGEGVRQHWLTPAAAQAALWRLYDLYLAGHYRQAAELIANYKSWIGAALKHTEIGLENEKSQFENLRGQLLDVANRLYTDADAFGNPPGWVPLLPLDVYLKIYQDEVDWGLRMFALSYRLEQVWERQDQRHAGWQQAIAALSEEGKLRRQELRNARAVLNELEPEQARIRQRTKTLQTQLADLEAAKEAEWRQEQESQRVGKAFLGVLRSIGSAMLFSAPFVGGNNAAPQGKAKQSDKGKPKSKGLGSGSKIAIVAGVGIGAELAANLLEPAPLPPAGGSVSAEFDKLLNNIELEQTWDALAKLRPETAQYPSGYVEKLRELSGVFAATQKQEIETQLRQSAEYQEQDRALLNRVLNDAGVRSLMNEFIDLIARYRLFDQHRTSALLVVNNNITRIGEISANIVQIRDALAGLAIDHSTRLTINQMKRRAQERLRLYQYYLVKSCEYQLLQTCPVDYFASDLYQRLSRQIKQDQENPTAVPEGELLQSLHAIYSDSLRQLAQQIVHELTTGRPQPVRDSNKRLALSAEELQRLNESGAVTVNLGSKLLQASDANARLIDVAIDPAYFRVAQTGSGQADAVCNMDIRMQLTSEFFIRWRGKDYYFRFASDPQVAQVPWGASWNSQTDTLVNYEHSDSFADLLGALFERLAPNKAITFRPGADTELLIRKQVCADRQPQDVWIEQLTLKVTIDKNFDDTKTLSMETR